MVTIALVTDKERMTQGISFKSLAFSVAFGSSWLRLHARGSRDAQELSKVGQLEPPVALVPSVTNVFCACLNNSF